MTVPRSAVRILAAAALAAGMMAATGGSVRAAECGTLSYNAQVVQSGNTWTASNGSRTVYTGTDLLAAMRAGVASLTAGRTSKQAVVVRGSGTVPANQSLDLPSYTVLDVCGTITATGTIAAHNAIVRMRNVHDVDVPNLKIAGNVYFGVLIRNGVNISL